MREAFDRRHVVGNHHAYHAGPRGAVGIRHCHDEVMGNLVAPFFHVFLCGLRKMIGVVQPAGVGIKARHFQIAFVRGYYSPRKCTVKNQHTTDDDGGHTVLRVDDHGTRGSSVPLAAQTTFLYMQNVAIGACRSAAVMRIVGVIDNGSIVIEIAGIDRRKGHVIVDVFPCSRALRIRIHIAARPAHVQTAQTIQSIQKSHIRQSHESDCRSPETRFGPDRQQEIRLIHSHEKVFAGNFRAFHGKRRHIFTGIGRIEVLELNNAAVFKRDDEVVAGTGQHGLIGRKSKNKTGLRVTDNRIGRTCGRSGEKYVSHRSLLKKKERKKEAKKRAINKQKPRTGYKPAQSLLKSKTKVG